MPKIGANQMIPTIDHGPPGSELKNLPGPCRSSPTNRAAVTASVTSAGTRISRLVSRFVVEGPFTGASLLARISHQGLGRAVEIIRCQGATGVVLPRNTKAVTMEPTSAPTSTVKVIQRTNCGRKAICIYTTKKEVDPEYMGG